MCEKQSPLQCGRHVTTRFLQQVLIRGRLLFCCTCSQAINDRHNVKIDIILTEEQNASFLEAMNTEGYHAIDRAVGNIRSENATASREDDLAAIRALVLSKPGGFATLNSTVKQVRWKDSFV